MSSRARSFATQVSGSGCQHAIPGQAIGGCSRKPHIQP